MFISFDGIDGVGKSTQMDLFCQWLASLGHQVVRCRDPGSTLLGEAIRRILLDDHETPISRTSEMLLYMAARAQMVDEIIRPALAEGKTVVADRYLLANVVYQGHAGGLDPESIWEVGRVATGGLMPDLTIVLDLDPGQAVNRLSGDLDRMEQQDEAFRTRLRQGFLEEARKPSAKIVVVDASGSREEVQERIRKAWKNHSCPP